MTNLQLIFVFINLTPIEVYILCIYFYKQELYFSCDKMLVQNYNKQWFENAKSRNHGHRYRFLLNLSSVFRTRLFEQFTMFFYNVYTVFLC